MPGGTYARHTGSGLLQNFLKWTREKLIKYGTIFSDAEVNNRFLISKYVLRCLAKIRAVGVRQKTWIGVNSFHSGIEQPHGLLHVLLLQGLQLLRCKMDVRHFLTTGRQTGTSSPHVHGLKGLHCLGPTLGHGLLELLGRLSQKIKGILGPTATLGLITLNLEFSRVFLCATSMSTESRGVRLK